MCSGCLKPTLTLRARGGCRRERAGRHAATVEYERRQCPGVRGAAATRHALVARSVGAMDLPRVGVIELTLVGANWLSLVGAIGLARAGARSYRGSVQGVSRVW